MQSDLIGKIEKARRYAAEPERIKFNELNVTFHGGNSNHTISLKDGHWSCDCSFFKHWGTCAHVMALQRILNPMLTDEARQSELPLPAHTEEEPVGA
ncbi:MAG: hypothetical protein HXY37_04145 [Chloroflexi bacterium]|nr:hypothetical protein [Chloroflexota bacterium]